MWQYKPHEVNARVLSEYYNRGRNLERPPKREPFRFLIWTHCPKFNEDWVMLSTRDRPLREHQKIMAIIKLNEPLLPQLRQLLISTSTL